MRDQNNAFNGAKRDQPMFFSLMNFKISAVLVQVLVFKSEKGLKTNELSLSRTLQYFQDGGCQKWQIQLSRFLTPKAAKVSRNGVLFRLVKHSLRSYSFYFSFRAT